MCSTFVEHTSSGVLAGGEVRRSPIPIFYLKDKYINHNNMASNIIKGDQIQMFDENDQALLYATSHTLTVTGNTVDTSSKDHGFFGSSEVGSVTWEISAECLYTDNNYDDLFDKMISGERQYIKWAKVGNYDVNGLTSTGGSVAKWNPSSDYKQGYAYITSLVANANTGENATFSVTFTGSGALTDIHNSQTLNYIDVIYDAMEAGETYTLWNGTGISGASGRAITLSTSTDVSFNSRQNTYTPEDNLTSLELRIYLRGTEIPSNLLQGTSIVSIEVGSTITNMGYATCASCTSLEAAILNDKTGLTSRLFQGCTSLESLTLPFKYYDETNQVWIGLPYHSGSYALSGTEESLTDLYVPSETVAWYEQTQPWSNLNVLAIS